MNDLADIPVVSGARGLGGHVDELRRDRLGLLERAAREGEVTALRVLGRRVVVLGEPGRVHEVLVEKARSFVHAASTRLLLQPLLGDGLFIREGEGWRRQRRRMAPLFTPAAVARHAGAMHAAAARVAGELAARDGASFEPLRATTRIAMAVAGSTLLGVDTLGVDAELGEALHTALQWAGRQAGSPLVLAQLLAVGGLRQLQARGPAALDAAIGRLLAGLRGPLLLPGAEARRFRAALATIDRYIGGVIAERRASAAARDDLLGALVRARDEDGAMTDREVRDEAVTLFVAGHETTAAALAWTLHLLATHPEVQAAVQAEADALTGPPGADDLPRLALCLRVFKEALRLYPPIYAFTREAAEDVRVGPHLLPRGTTIYVSPWVLHRQPALWPAPARFDPARFTAEAEDARPRAAWLPFGAGPRTCIGLPFALLEGAVVLATLARRLRFDPGAAPPTPAALATLRPAPGFALRARRREAPVRRDM
jgi:cytochrome P450